MPRLHISQRDLMSALSRGYSVDYIYIYTYTQTYLLDLIIRYFHERTSPYTMHLRNPLSFHRRVMIMRHASHFRCRTLAHTFSKANIENKHATSKYVYILPSITSSRTIIVTSVGKQEKEMYICISCLLSRTDDMRPSLHRGVCILRIL